MNARLYSPKRATSNHSKHLTIQNTYGTSDRKPATYLFESLKLALLGKDKGGDPFDLGFDCGKNGANLTNCSFSIFRNKETTRAWERGKAAGEKAKEQNQ